MTDKEKIAKLSHCFEEVIWMAIRYADGRRTFAPSTVRDAVRSYQKIYPEWKPKRDRVIEKPTPDMIGGLSFESDYLWDIVNQEINEI